MLYQTTDAEPPVRATGWAGSAGTAADQVFNVTTGDQFRWSGLWPRFAEHRHGLRPPQQMSLTEAVPTRADAWQRLVDRRGERDEGLSGGRMACLRADTDEAAAVGWRKTDVQSPKGALTPLLHGRIGPGCARGALAHLLCDLRRCCRSHRACGHLLEAAEPPPGGPRNPPDPGAHAGRRVAPGTICLFTVATQVLGHGWAGEGQGYSAKRSPCTAACPRGAYRVVINGRALPSR